MHAYWFLFPHRLQGWDRPPRQPSGEADRIQVLGCVVNVVKKILDDPVAAEICCIAKIMIVEPIDDMKIIVAVDCQVQRMARARVSFDIVMGPGSACIR